MDTKKTLVRADQGTFLINSSQNGITGTATPNIVTPNIVPGTVITINKDGDLISRRAQKINGVITFMDDEKDGVKVSTLEHILPRRLKIRNIAYCDKPGKEKVILVFEDDSKIIKEMNAGDTFDLNIGVALAFMEQLCGTKSQYHKMIQKKLSKKK